MHNQDGGLPKSRNFSHKIIAIYKLVMSNCIVVVVLVSILLSASPTVLQEEKELCSLTMQFEDFLLVFLDR